VYNKKNYLESAQSNLEEELPGITEGTPLCFRIDKTSIPNMSAVVKASGGIKCASSRLACNRTLQTDS
jgi:hypothetical protein